MLQTLRVKNLAIVENLRVDFSRGLNVVTGETGAGKSILVGALELVLGERADKTLIRSGEDECGVEAVFQLADAAEIDAILEGLGLDPCEDGRLIIRRLILASGAGRNLVNDCPATLNVLRQLGNLLVDMHGPHDHQSLLSRDFQMELLDAYGHLWGERQEYETVYRRLLDLQAQHTELTADGGDMTGRMDTLAEQIGEIEAAELGDTDEDELKKEHARIANAHHVLELAQGARLALTEDDISAFNSLVSVQRALRGIADLIEEGQEWVKEAEAIAIQVQELSNGVADTVQNMEGDPGRLEWIEDRMALLHKLRRKYGNSVETILAFAEDARTQLSDLETRADRLAGIEKELATAQTQVREKGRRLSSVRAGSAKSLASDVTRELRDLGFAHGSFDVMLEACDPGPVGMDGVEFGFAPNVGEAMRPLRAIASSGEISRVMLATKAVLAGHDRIPVLVFDEIDANVGGEMGHAVGQKLAAVSESHQVLCITHLPQVAAHGTTHFVVSKEVSRGRTRTSIAQVDKDARVEEVARMLGGGRQTRVSLAHAREMLSPRPRG